MLLQYPEDYFTQCLQLTTEREIGGVISYTEELSDSSISYINTSAAAEQDTIRGDNNQTAPLVELQLGDPGMQMIVTRSIVRQTVLLFCILHSN